MVSNIIFNMFGNFQISTKFWTLDPAFIVKYLETTRASPKHLKWYFCISENPKSLFLEILCAEPFEMFQIEIVDF